MFPHVNVISVLTPLMQQQQDSSPAALLSRVRHAIGVSMNSRRVKELVVALEWSQNEAVLGEILKWAEEFGGKQITVRDLAPYMI